MAGSPSKRTTPKAGDERPATVLSPAQKRAQAKAAAAKRPAGIAEEANKVIGN